MVNSFQVKQIERLKSTLQFLKKNYSSFFNFEDEERYIKLLEFFVNLNNKNGDIMSDNDNTGKRWTDEELSILINGLMNGKTINDLYEEIDRTRKSIGSKANHLGFKMFEWNNHDLKVLIQGIKDKKPIKQIASDLNTDELVVDNKLKNLKLVKGLN